MTPRHTTPDNEPSTAIWRMHFPVESKADADQSRRGFLSGLAIAGGTMACCQAVLSSDATDQENTDEDSSDQWATHAPLVLEKKLNELSDGEAMLFHFPNHRSPCLLVRFSSDDFVAFSQKCTHLACPVIPEFEHNEFHCPCHHGIFDLRTGAPKSGPPRRPLPQVRVELKPDGTLVANAMQKNT